MDIQALTLVSLPLHTGINSSLPPLHTGINSSLCPFHTIVKAIIFLAATIVVDHFL